ncbi:MAG: metallophosphoesterase [Oscillospiraceae bacterium]|nr:metallophosphoesterase [Oscillospiraceae bacterium]
MKYIRIILGLFLALLMLCACTAPESMSDPASEPAQESVRIVVASDLHYLSQALTDNGPLFRRVVEHGDGKLMLDIEAITEAFIEQMISEHPDAVVLTGDLSFNGEVRSLADLAEKLGRLQEADVPVLVIPGNHDVRRSDAYCYSGDSYEPVPSARADDFHELYADFGPRQARSVDELSGSYVWDAAEGLRLLLLDTNSAAVNSFPSESLDWLEEELREAQEAGAQVICFSHQNLLIHNSMFVFGYQISNADAVIELLTRYGVLANMCGHMHIQHVLDGSVPEVLSSPLSLVPCRYGLLAWDNAGLTYEARSTDVSAWARRHGRTEEQLLDFDKYAEESFYQNCCRQISERYGAAELPEGALERMASCFADTNLAYFTGAAPERERLLTELDFWVSAAGESFETAYLRGILKDESPDPLYVKLR